MSYNATSAGRAALIVALAEVYGTVMDLRKAMNGKVCVDLGFTIGNLAGLRYRVAVGETVTPTETLYVNGVAQTGDLTASTDGQFVFDCAGHRYVRFAVTGLGADNTNSLCDFQYLYDDYSLAPAVDGVPRVDG